MGQRLGQHFLKNPHYAEILARASGIRPEDTILEIGPGTGALTKHLLATGSKVIAIEKDEALVEVLKSTFAEEISKGQLEILSADVRDFDPTSYKLQAGHYVVAANIPYYITGELVRKFLEADVQPHTISFLMQKEVAQRIISEKESILSISVKAYGSPHIEAKVSRGNFSPPPAVDSAILVISDISKKNFADIDERSFFEVLRAGFSSKRKLLAGNLRGAFPDKDVAEALSQAGIDQKARAETIHLEGWVKLARNLHYRPGVGVAVSTQSDAASASDASVLRINECPAATAGEAGANAPVSLP